MYVHRRLSKFKFLTGGIVFPVTVQNGLITAVWAVVDLIAYLATVSSSSTVA